MKLLYCMKCSDIFNLSLKEKKCSCGKTKGKYLDNLYAQYQGPCMPLGISNFSLKKALGNQNSQGLGPRFEAFVIPRLASTMKKLDKFFNFPKSQELSIEQLYLKMLSEPINFNSGLTERGTKARKKQIGHLDKGKVQVKKTKKSKV